MTGEDQTQADNTDPKIAPAEDPNRTGTLHELFLDGRDDQVQKETEGLTPFDENQLIPPITVIEPVKENNEYEDPNITREEPSFGREQAHPISPSSQLEQSVSAYVPPQQQGEQAAPGSDSRQKVAAKGMIERMNNEIKSLEGRLLNKKVEKIRFLQTQGRQGIFDAQMIIIECLSERPRVLPRIEYRTFEEELISSYIRGEDYQKAIDEATKMKDDESRYLKSLQERIATLDSKSKIPADAQGGDIQKHDTIPASEFPSNTMVKRREHLDKLISESKNYLQIYEQNLAYAQRMKEEKARQGKTDTYRKAGKRIDDQINMALDGDDDIDKIIEGPPTLGR